MNLTFLNWTQIIKKSDLPSSAKLVGFVLSTYMNYEQEVAWPSIRRLAADTGLSQPTVIKWLDYLEKEAYIIKRRSAHVNWSNGGNQRNNEYWINIPDRLIRGLSELSTPDKGAKTDEPRCLNESSKVLKPLNTNTNINTNNNTKGRFIPPSVDEVRAYCLDRQNGIDPDSFVDHYSANGWMRGKTKIKDWKACVRTWEKNKQPEKEIWAGCK